MILQVLRKEPCPDLPGEALLANLLELMPHHCDNQALMCLQARQQMQLGRFEDTLQTVSGFLGGVGSGVVPSHWALHVTVHVHWLTGGVEQVCLRPHPLPEVCCVFLFQRSVVCASFRGLSCVPL